MILKVKRLEPSAKLPTRGTAGSAGLDLYLSHPARFEPYRLTRGRTGIAVAIPSGYVGLIKPRSSAWCEGLDITPGVIDSDYRGEIMLTGTWRNLSTMERPGLEYRVFAAGTRIAQLLIVPIVAVKIEATSELDSTDRGEGGFGSTGV